MSQTALVLIEFQNDFVSEGGALHDGVKAEIARTGMIDRTIALVNAARAKGVKIVWVPIEFAKGYPELASAPYGILAGVKATQAFQKGEWGARIIDALSPEGDDIVISGKRGLCSFASTNLDFVLRHNGITRVALGGFLTDCCVESTMRTAYELGYDVVTLTDCTATLSQAQHEAAIQYTYPMFSRPMTSEAFLATL
ncbi:MULTISPECIES: isochorismatase family cysteine hydrolase [Asaia]|uniref:Isochorismatase n=1 Tax=Asaia bogorensis TaxID=91915 RepID=A0A060QBZ5_9PROT|nr:MULTISPECIES: isochorismatase family cysteine hydrolase [Asaia]ETC98654.1 isochorismatase hydrolase [Asaia sp. SF2.1]MDL2169946.1 cysteine hydrolase [Asaia sp. HumB]CDG38173.1 Isochorismatase [Asaia bogorensis]